MPAFGVYPIADALNPGDEISSTYEGRHVTVLESDLIHPVHATAFVDKGDPVVFGAGASGEEVGVGVALGGDANTVATDLIAVDTEGIWNLDVVAVNDAGNSAVIGGEQLYINTTTAVISKIRNAATQIRFGYALGILVAGVTEAIAVKVHFDPPDIGGQDRMYKTVTSGDFGLNLLTTLAGGASEGVGGYIEAHLTAALTGHTYGFGSWINVDDVGLLAAGHIITPFEGGIYASGAEATARIVFVGQGQYVGAGGVPASIHAWRLNVAQAGGNITALIAAANPESVAYRAGTAGTGVVGTIPLADVVGTGVVYVDVHAAVA